MVEQEQVKRWGLGSCLKEGDAAGRGNGRGNEMAISSMKCSRGEAKAVVHRASKEAQGTWQRFGCGKDEAESVESGRQWKTFDTMRIG